MARARMVTRTIDITTAQILCLDVTTSTVTHLEVEIPGGVNTDTAIMKWVKKYHETSTFKCVSVVNATINEVLYGMPEEDFILYAKRLEKR